MRPRQTAVRGLPPDGVLLPGVTDSATVFVEHRDGVFRYLCRVVGHTETARDLTQEVFLRVTRAASRPDAANERRAWIFRIARNLALNHARDAGRRRGR